MPAIYRPAPARGRLNVDAVASRFSLPMWHYPGDRATFLPNDIAGFRPKTASSAHRLIMPCARVLLLPAIDATGAGGDEKGFVSCQKINSSARPRSSTPAMCRATARPFPCARWKPKGWRRQKPKRRRPCHRWRLCSRARRPHTDTLCEIGLRADFIPLMPVRAETKRRKCASLAQNAQANAALKPRHGRPRLAAIGV